MSLPSFNRKRRPVFGESTGHIKQRNLMRSVAGNLRTELICHMAGGIANLNQLMGRA